MTSFGLMLLVRRSLRQHALSSVVTCLSVGLAAGLTIAVFAINRQTYDAFTGGDAGFDAVLGARGSQERQGGVEGMVGISWKHHRFSFQ